MLDAILFYCVKCSDATARLVSFAVEDMDSGVRRIALLPAHLHEGSPTCCHLLGVGGAYSKGSRDVCFLIDHASLHQWLAGWLAGWLAAVLACRLLTQRPLIHNFFFHCLADFFSQPSANVLKQGGNTV